MTISIPIGLAATLIALALIPVAVFIVIVCCSYYTAMNDPVEHPVDLGQSKVADQKPPRPLKRPPPPPPPQKKEMSAHLTDKQCCPGDEHALCEGNYPCCARSHDGYGCSRNIGHTGNHIACGIHDHNLAIW